MAPSPEIASPFPRDTASCPTLVTSPALSARHLHKASPRRTLPSTPPFHQLLSALSILSIAYPFSKRISILATLVLTVVVKSAESYHKVKKSTSAKPTGDVYSAHPERDLQGGDPNLVGGAPPEAKKTMAEKVKGLFKGHHRDDDDEDTDSAVGSGVGRTPEASPYGTVDTGSNLSGNAVDSTAPGKEESGVQSQGETGGEALTDHQGNLKPGPHTDSVKRQTVFSKIKDKVHGSK